MTKTRPQPEHDEFELALLGPGYGESAVMHIGNGAWIVVDSCISPNEDTPAPLRYLDSIGLDPADAVALVVVTHWHDDHIRGAAQVLDACPVADFCCASAFVKDEFLALVGALGQEDLSLSGSGMRELHEIFSMFRKFPERRRTFAAPNRVLRDRDNCRIWSLSPSDDVFQNFLMSVGSMVPGFDEPMRRIPALRKNDISVVLRVETAHFSLLLGADLENAVGPPSLKV